MIIQPELVSWKVFSEVEYDDAEYFRTLKEASENASERLARAHIVPVYHKNENS